ncbi:hypothetical protein [Streptomyces sp. NPDC059893]|uniref:hypothetical protein n=1 Tax=Streptomyces sp. NPDC059893 TaxID=3346990 RepID=UPI0036497225
MSSTAFPSRPQRRTVLRGLLAGAAVATASACSSSNPTPKDPTFTPTTSAAATPSDTSGSDTGRVLLAYFSRPGENDYYGKRHNLKVGNTEVLAGVIADRITCDVYRIKAADPYSDSYDDTVGRNVREGKATPAPTSPTPCVRSPVTTRSCSAAPIWNVRAR